ncbi:MAG: hypothetical protein ABIP35_17245 [Ginsengibacter sp.]
MQRFFYNEKIKIGGLLTQLNSTMELFSARHYDADKLLVQLMKDCIQMYKDLGYSEKESQVQSMQAEWAISQRGINPYTLVRQITRRNEMTATVAFKILQAIEILLRNDYVAGDEKIGQASDLISQIIVAALQANLLTDVEIKKIKTQKEIESTWKKLGSDSNLLLGQKRVLLLVSRFDALIIFDDLLTPLKK